MLNSSIVLNSIFFFVGELHNRACRYHPTFTTHNNLLIKRDHCKSTSKARDRGGGDRTVQSPKTGFDSTKKRDLKKYAFRSIEQDILQFAIGNKKTN
jgi:hypothetical protein